MTAHDQIRKMLDELMGTGRDGTVSHDVVPFTDSRVCRTFLIGCCPHDVLANTRMDMGDCLKIHDPALRADFEKAQAEKDLFYDLDGLDHLERFFEDCDRKNEMSKRRLADTQEELSAECSEKANKVLELNEQIGKTLAEAEQLGEEGKVDESLKMMEKVEEIRKEKAAAELDYRNSMPASSYQQQKLRVCEVCGAYLGIHDNDRRLADHFGGKLHMGFVFLRERFAELQAKAPDRRQARDKQRYGGGGGGGGGGRYDRRSSRDRDYYRRSTSSRRDDDYDRYKRKRSRSRDRSRSHKIKRSRSKERDHRSSSRRDSKSSRHSSTRDEGGRRHSEDDRGGHGGHHRHHHHSHSHSHRRDPQNDKSASREDENVRKPEESKKDVHLSDIDD